MHADHCSPREDIGPALPQEQALGRRQAIAFCVKDQDFGLDVLVLVEMCTVLDELGVDLPALGESPPVDAALEQLPVYLGADGEAVGVHLGEEREGIVEQAVSAEKGDLVEMGFGRILRVFEIGEGF